MLPFLAGLSMSVLLTVLILSPANTITMLGWVAWLVVATLYIRRLAKRGGSR